MKKTLFFSTTIIVATVGAIFWLKFFNQPIKVEFFNQHNEPQATLEVTVADSAKERQLGLMFRENLPDDEGLLFIFDKTEKHAMWMKNMRIHIDLIFLNEKKEIIKIYEDLPPCETLDCHSYQSENNVAYAIETAAGFIEKFHINENTRVSFN